MQRLRHVIYRLPSARTMGSWSPGPGPTDRTRLRGADAAARRPDGPRAGRRPRGPRLLHRLAGPGVLPRPGAASPGRCARGGWGWRDAGVVTVLKHWPGHGQTPQLAHRTGAGAAAGHAEGPRPGAVRARAGRRRPGRHGRPPALPRPHPRRHADQPVPRRAALPARVGRPGHRHRSPTRWRWRRRARRWASSPARAAVRALQGRAPTGRWPATRPAARGRGDPAGPGRRHASRASRPSPRRGGSSRSRPAGTRAVTSRHSVTRWRSGLTGRRSRL